MGRLNLLPMAMVVVLLFHAAATAQSPQSVRDVQILSVSGCVDVHPVTVNCSLSTTLRLVTAGFPATVNWSRRPLNIAAQVNGYTYFTTTGTWLDSTDPTNSSAFVNITANAYYPHITGTLVALWFVDHATAGYPTSAAFDGFSFVFEAAPTLTSISGCNGSGSSTLDCVPDGTTLTLTGSALSWYGPQMAAQVNIGSQATTDTSSSLQVVNDTYATLSLAYIYSSLLGPQQYNGALLSFSLSSWAHTAAGSKTAFYTTNALQLSFVALPPPIITSWLISSCNQSDFNLAAYNNCRPGVSLLALSGHYMYGLQANLSGHSCSPSSTFPISSTVFYCNLPTFDYDPSVAYDLVMYDSTGNASQTFTGMVQYTSQPTLVSIDSCIDRGDIGTALSLGVQCPVGTTVTLRGARFMAADSVVVQLIPWAQTNVNVSWYAPTLIDSSTITITLTALNNVTAAAVYGQYGLISVLFTTAGVTIVTNTALSTLFGVPNAPNITSITSSTCVSLSPLQLTQCHAMASITITGSYLAMQGAPLLATSSLGLYRGTSYLLAAATSSNASFDAVSNQSLVFSLPYFDADTNADRLQPDIVYSSLLLSRVAAQPSNAFRISLAYDTDDTHSSTSGNKLSTGAIAGIVIAAIVAGLLLVVLVVWRVRRSHVSAAAASHWSSKRADDGGLRWSMGSATAHGSSSEDYKDVELQ